MASLIGQPINARELEQTTSQWSPEHFASMCDALAWAASGKQCSTLPSFTSRVSAPDGGIDADWNIEIPDDGSSIPTPLLGSGWNVFQYKKRDLMAEDRSRIISKLKSSIRGAVAEIEKKFGRTPNRYILFVNVDLKHDQTRAIKEAALDHCVHPADIHVEIAGAAELAALLNNYPYLRAAYFAPISFKTWQEAYNAHRSHKFLGADVELIGRRGEIDQLRTLVQDEKVRIIVVTGPHDIGKSRLVLEATKERLHDVIIALDPRSMDVSDYRNLTSGQSETICIVEDPEPYFIDSMAIEALAIPNLKLIVTLPTPSFISTPAYGRDERIQNLHLEPLDDECSRELLKAAGHPLDFEIEDWIARQARGIPGILLAAASVGSELRRKPGDFLGSVGKEFEKRIQSELGDDVLRTAELFSILTHVGISGEFESELRHICSLFTGGWQPADAIRVLDILEQAGLAKRAGSFVEIAIPMLANYLVGRLLCGRRKEMFALFARLEEPGRLRFLRRLCEMQGPEIEGFWDELFSSDGPLGNLKSALDRTHILNLVSGATPLRALKLLEKGLINTSREERLAISGEARRELMWALDQLLFREKTSRGALTLVWLLSEAENESYGNNATGVLEECLHPLHGQMPLPLDQRIEALKEFISDKASKEGKIVAIKAAGEALSRGTSFMVRHSTGPAPLDSMPEFTYGEFYDYARDLLDILISAATDADSDVAAAALKALPSLTAECGIQGRPQDAIVRFQTLVDWALKGKPGLEVASLFDALNHVHHVFSDSLNKPDYPNDRKEELKRFIDELAGLKIRLEKGAFLVRLKRWAGSWTMEDDEDVSVKGRYITRCEQALEKLAEEVVKNPHLLSSQVISWLVSDSAQKSHTFFFYLGLKDTNGLFLHLIEEVGQKLVGSVAFSAYWGGWARRDRRSAEEHLEELSASNAVTGKAIVQAIAWIGASQSAVDMIKTQLKARRVDAFITGRLLRGPWIKDLTSDQFEELLKAIAGDQFENASTAVHMVGSWLHYKHSLHDGLGNFAWCCLESNPPVQPPTGEWQFDQLAAELAKNDPERGFRLLEKLLLKEDNHQHWNPIDRYGRHRFWNVLYETDKERLLEALFKLCQTDPLHRFRVTWSLKDLLDLEADGDLLTSYAKKDEEIASIISESITSAKPGFWPIAFELVEEYPSNERIKSHLAAGIEQQGNVIPGPFSRFYEGRKAEVEQWLHNPKTPTAVRSWLREMADRLRQEISHQVVWEYDRDVNELRRHIDDKDSPERIWAIGRVLRYGNPEDWKKLLSVEDIQEALPQIDLPEKKRKIIERALKVWINGI
jgi:hypothetical protein